MAQKSIEELLKSVEKDLAEGNCSAPDLGSRLREAFARLDQYWQWTMDLLDVAEKIGDEDIQLSLNALKKERKKEAVSRLSEELLRMGYRIGHRIKGTEEINEKSIAQSLYRIYELSRLGKRSEVFYILLRAFTSNRISMPRELAQAFRPIYSLEEFKVLIFSFLSGMQKALLLSNDTE